MPTENLGLRFVFSRDHAFKFQRTDAGPKGPDALDSQRWHVAGMFDLLDVTPIDALDRIEVVERSISSFGDLVLFPVDNENADKLRSVNLERPADHVFMSCLRIRLSPAAYEFSTHYDCVFGSIVRMASLLKPTLGAEGFPMTILFHSLGSPDLVIVSLPRTPLELRMVQTLERKARTALLRDIRAPGVAEAACPGHACSLVEPILAFRPQKELFDSVEFRAQEEQIGMVLRFAMRIDSGHEGPIIADFETTFPYVEIDKAPAGAGHLLASAPYTIHGAFKHFADFITVLKDRWYLADWREANLVDTVTVLFIPEVIPVPNHDAGNARKAWKLQKRVVTELKDIRDKLDKFGREFLGQASFAELKRVFESFESCFYRFEYLGVARDLFPFFKQLANAFSYTDLWTEYMSDGHDVGRKADRFDNQIAVLLAHLARAVRNRMEYRSVHSDLFLATTLEHGACKLVSTYTVVFWLCSELFRRRVEHKATDVCDSDHFAACLSAGVEGRVECRELFADFRRFVESRKQRPISEMTDSSDWAAQLLLLEISGKSLLRPELCLVHCMHEVAELSDWIRSSRCNVLRFKMNEWILKEVIANARYLIRSSGGSGGAPLSASRKDYIEGLIVCRVLSYCRPNLDFKSIKTEEEELAVLGEILTHLHPEHFAVSVVKALATNAFPDGPDETKTFLQSQGYDDPVPNIATLFSNEKFLHAVMPLINLVPELIGDIGMWCALDHILGQGRAREADQRFDDLCRIYESLLVAVSESRGVQRSRATIEGLILHRWVLQAVAVLQAESQENVINRILARTDGMRNNPRYQTIMATAASQNDMRMMLKHSVSFPIQFGTGESLVSLLQSFRSYGGKENDLQFPTLANFPIPVKELIDTFVKAWEKANDDRLRVQLAMALWAKSERLTFERILEVAGGTNEPPTDH